MKMLENTTIITPEQLASKAQSFKLSGYRFATATCCDNGDNTLDVYYHFEKNYELFSVKITVEKMAIVPSISNIYFCAVLVENEMKELFGLNVSGMVIDYEGHLLLSEDAPSEPMARNITIVQKSEVKE